MPKGPQGTLYGQNATGSAANYIAAKPTEAFDTGMDPTYGRFNPLQVGSYVGGPISGAWVDRRRERFDSGPGNSGSWRCERGRIR